MSKKKPSPTSPKTGQLIVHEYLVPAEMHAPIDAMIRKTKPFKTQDVAEALQGVAKIEPSLAKAIATRMMSRARKAGAVEFRSGTRTWLPIKQAA